MATKQWTHGYFIVDRWLSKSVQVAIIFRRVATKPWTHDYFIVDGWLLRVDKWLLSLDGWLLNRGHMATLSWTDGY